MRNKSACAVGASGAIVIIDRTIGSWGIANAYTIDTVFRYLPFFAAGALVYMRPTLFEAFLRTRTADWVLLAIAAAIRYFWPNAGAATIISGEIVYYQAGFLFTIFVVKLSRKYMNYRTSTQQNLVDAAFSIYLFPPYLCDRRRDGNPWLRTITECIHEICNRGQCWMLRAIRASCRDYSSLSKNAFAIQWPDTNQ